MVLTFDDGPLPKYSNQILDILAAQCVKATFFMVGRQAKANPEGVRKVRDAGHTVGTHSQNHPLTMQPDADRTRQAGDRRRHRLGHRGAWRRHRRSRRSSAFPACCAPKRSRNISASKGIQVWSADFPADDWRHVSSAARLRSRDPAARGQGQRHPAAARHPGAHGRGAAEDPARAEGARLSHRPRGAGDAGAAGDADRAAAMAVASASETVAISRWPKIPNFVFADTAALPAPALSDLDWRATASATRANPRCAVAAAIAVAANGAAASERRRSFAGPGRERFRIPESTRVTMLGASPTRRGSQTAEASRETEVAAKPVPARRRKVSDIKPASPQPARRSRHGAHQVSLAAISARACQKERTFRSRSRPEEALAIGSDSIRTYSFS